MFGAITKPRTVSGPARATAVALLSLVIVGAGVSTWRSATGHAEDSATAGASPHVTVEVRQTPEPAFLELVGLEHARDGDGLTVRGAVHMHRGPTRSVTAVVTLLRAGQVVASRSAALQAPAPVPQPAMTFSIWFPDALDAERSRVTFADAAGIVPHLDRRH